MNHEISYHRSYQIPKGKLDAFLDALSSRFSEAPYIKHEMRYVFDFGESYEVVVAAYGSYPYLEIKLQEFVQEIKAMEVPELEIK